MAWHWYDDQWWRYSSWNWSEAGHDWQLSASWHSWWRDPEQELQDAENIADKDYTSVRVAAG